MVVNRRVYVDCYYREAPVYLIYEGRAMTVEIVEKALDNYFSGGGNREELPSCFEVGNWADVGKEMAAYHF